MFFSLKRQWPFSDIGTFYEQEYLIKEFSFFIFCINELIIWLTCNPFFWSWSSIGVSILVFQYNLDWCHQIDSAYPPRHNVMNSQQFIFSLLLLYSRVSSEQCCRYTSLGGSSYFGSEFVDSINVYWNSHGIIQKYMNPHISLCFSFNKMRVNEKMQIIDWYFSINRKMFW